MPPGYEWLASVGTLPRTIQQGLKLYGTAEVVGKGSNKTIISWRDELNIAGNPVVGFSDDDVPWCGLFAAIVTYRAGYDPVNSPLWARNWAKFGKASTKPGLGDVLVFVRETGGHVGFYVAEDATAYHVLGGNQSNRVSITRVAKARLIAARRPLFAIGQPASVKPYRTGANGALSRNEA
jgi:uncharacterized protein (TIGR02594 family)